MIERDTYIAEKLVVVPNFFAIESLDGVGKSSTIKELASRGLTTHKTPPDHLLHLREKANASSLKERFDYYMRGVVETGKQAFLGPRDIQLSDRYVLTTLSAHEAMGLPHSYLKDQLLKYSPYMPEATILLTASDEVRLQRLQIRGANQNDIENLRINDHIFEGFVSWAQELNHPLYTIDTSSMDISEVADKIIQHAK